MSMAPRLTDIVTVKRPTHKKKYFHQSFGNKDLPCSLPPLFLVATGVTQVLLLAY
ncbi:hypothetical protein BgiMline_009334, partial [Biomphalaria glabrata]